MRVSVSVVIAAAGSGSRFGGEVPKQLLPLGGIPILVRSIRAFTGLVDEVVLAISPTIREHIERMIVERSWDIPTTVVDGGETRQRSVYAGIRATSALSEVVLVHDAARPLVPRSCIEGCIAALRHHDGAVVAIPCAHTVKRAAIGAAIVEQTVPRDDLWLAQTPQGFRRTAGLDAFARAERENRQCSDDAQVLETAGYVVALVAGDPRNLKITTAGDLAIAEALLTVDRN